MTDLLELLKEILQGYFTSFMQALPKFVQFLAILLIGWIIAKLVSKAVGKVLEKIQVDKMIDKLNLHELFGSKDFSKQITNIIVKFIYYFIFLITLSTAVDSLQMAVLTELIKQAIDFFPMLMIAVIIFVIGYYISTFIRDLITTATRSVGMASGGLLGNGVFYFLLIMVSITALEQLQIDTSLITNNISILIAGIIIAGALAYALAAVDVMGNILSVFFAKKTFAVGQYIRIGDIEGQIIEISSVNITIAQKGKRVVIPARQFTKESVIISIDEIKEIDD